MEDELIVDIDLRVYWELFKRWFWLIALAGLLAGMASYAVSKWMLAPVYRATVQVVVQPSSSLGQTSYQDILAGQRVASTYAEMLKSLPVQEEALTKLGYSEMQILAFEQNDFPYDLTVQPLRDTQVIEVQVESTDPQLATNFANMLVEVFIAENQERQTGRFQTTQLQIEEQMVGIESEIENLRDRLEETSDGGERAQMETRLAQLQDSLSRYATTYQSVQLAQLQAVDLVSVVQPARVPRWPVRPRKAMNALIAAVLGGMVALGAIFLREVLDTSVRDSDQAETITRSPVLGQIWYEQEIANSNGAGSKVVIQKPLSLTAEAFRLLRANLQFAAVDSPLRVLLISSPGPTEGKSTISLNLSLALAAAGRRVIIIDADMRRPKVAAYAGIRREPGLSDLLVDREGGVADYLQPVEEMDRVAVLPPGKTPPNPAELLGSRRMGEVLLACQELADIVIVDSPPVLAAADAAVLAAQTDGVLLVLEAGSSERKAVEQATEQLKRSGAQLLGSVMNKVPMNGRQGYYYYYYDSETEDQQSFLDKLLKRGKKGKTHRRKMVESQQHTSSDSVVS